MDFSALTAYLDSLKDVGMPGCDLAVYRDHRKIYRHRGSLGKVRQWQHEQHRCLPSKSKLLLPLEGYTAARIRFCSEGKVLCQ